MHLHAGETEQLAEDVVLRVLVLLKESYSDGAEREREEDGVDHNRDAHVDDVEDDEHDEHCREDHDQAADVSQA